MASEDKPDLQTGLPLLDDFSVSWPKNLKLMDQSMWTLLTFPNPTSRCWEGENWVAGDRCWFDERILHFGIWFPFLSRQVGTPIHASSTSPRPERSWVLLQQHNPGTMWPRGLEGLRIVTHWNLVTLSSSENLGCFVGRVRSLRPHKRHLATMAYEVREFLTFQQFCLQHEFTKTSQRDLSPNHVTPFEMCFSIPKILVEWPRVDPLSATYWRSDKGHGDQVKSSEGREADGGRRLNTQVHGSINIRRLCAKGYSKEASIQFRFRSKRKNPRSV